ncbi:MAG: transposase [Hyphomicrobiaceae bacterium]|nr:transposase [Hyphomicrobiaceae bacterium]
MRDAVAAQLAHNHRDDITGQLRLSFAEIEKGEVYEYAALVTSLDAEILTLGQLYRDRADCENVFDELKNPWGWGEFTTHDLARCRLAARLVALVYNWWNLFVRLAEPTRHLEAISSRPLLLTSIASAFVTPADELAHYQHPRRSLLGGRCFGAHRRLFAWADDKCGAVDPHRALVSHPPACASDICCKDACGHRRGGGAGR